MGMNGIAGAWESLMLQRILKWFQLSKWFPMKMPVSFSSNKQCFWTE